MTSAVARSTPRLALNQRGAGYGSCANAEMPVGSGVQRPYQGSGSF